MIFAYRALLIQDATPKTAYEWQWWRLSLGYSGPQRLHEQEHKSNPSPGEFQGSRTGTEVQIQSSFPPPLPISCIYTTYEHILSCFLNSNLASPQKKTRNHSQKETAKVLLIYSLLISLHTVISSAWWNEHSMNRTDVQVKPHNLLKMILQVFHRQWRWGSVPCTRPVSRKVCSQA